MPLCGSFFCDKRLISRTRSRHTQDASIGRRLCSRRTERCKERDMVSRPEIASAHRASEAECSNSLLARTIGDAILARFSRREALRGLTAVAALASLAPVGAAVFARNVRAGDAPALDFEEVPHGEYRDARRPRRLRGADADPLGRPGGGRRAGVRSAAADGGGAGEAVGLQQRLRRLDAAARRLRQRRARAPVRQLRVHRRAADVSRPARRATSTR